MKISELEELIRINKANILKKGMEIEPSKELRLLEEMIAAIKKQDMESKDPEININDYLAAYADGLKIHKSEILNIQFLDGLFSDKEIFQEWIKEDRAKLYGACFEGTSPDPKIFQEWLTLERLAGNKINAQQIAKPFQASLDRWLTREHAKLEPFNPAQAGWKKYDGLNTAELVAKLDELKSQVPDVKSAAAELDAFLSWKNSTKTDTGQTPKWLQDKKGADSEFKKRQDARHDANYQQNRTMAEIRYITSLIAHKNASAQINQFAAAKLKNPDATIELFILKRHDESTEIFKRIGLRRDTPLTALHLTNAFSRKLNFAKQTKRDLHLSLMVHTAGVDALHSCGLIDEKVDINSSPVSRAAETTAHSTLSPGKIRKVTVEREYTETKHNWLQREFAQSSDQSEEKPGKKQIEKTFSELRARAVPVDISPTAFEKNSSDPEEQDQRVERAAQKIVKGLPGQKPPEEKKRNEAKHVPVDAIQEQNKYPAKLTFLVAHGNFIRDMLVKIKLLSNNSDNRFKCSIPPGDKMPGGNLEYGGYYTLCVARDDKGVVQDIDYDAKHSRYGVERPSLFMSASEFRSQTKIKSGRATVPEKFHEIEKTLQDLQDYVRPKKKKSMIALFFTKQKPQVITDETQYNAAIDKLTRTVTGLLEPNPPSNAQQTKGLRNLREQLVEYTTRKTAAAALSSEPAEEKQLRRTP